MSSPASVRVLDTPTDKLDMLMLGAVHEVTHLVVADACGLKCSWLRIRRHYIGMNVSGWTEPDLVASGWETDPHDPRYFKPTQQQMQAFQMCCVAGGVGVGYWFARAWQSTSVDGVPYTYGTSCDMRMARWIATRAGSGLSLTSSKVKALELTARHWPRIARGALLLQRRRSMPARKV